MLTGLLTLIVWMLLLGLIVWLVNFIIGRIPGLPGEVKSVVIAVVYILAAIIVLIWLIGFVSSYLPVPGSPWPRLR